MVQMFNLDKLELFSQSDKTKQFNVELNNVFSFFLVMYSTEIKRKAC